MGSFLEKLRKENPQTTNVVNSAIRAARILFGKDEFNPAREEAGKAASKNPTRREGFRRYLGATAGMPEDEAQRRAAAMDESRRLTTMKGFAQAKKTRVMLGSDEILTPEEEALVNAEIPMVAASDGGYFNFGKTSL